VSAAPVLLGAAVLLAGWDGAGRRDRAHPGSGRHRLLGAPSTALLAVAAAAAIVSLCVCLLGLRLGGAVALPLIPVTWTGLERLRAWPARTRVDPLLPRTLDLAAAALRSGLPVASALAVSAPAASQPTARSLESVAGMLRLGAAPAEAWADLADHPQLGRLARIARRGAASGIRLAGMWETAAHELRGELRATALGRAARAGVLAMAPLGLCFLPAFVCLGIVPDVIALVGGAWGSWR
jgi:Flp pilus assembly protein TadB